LPGEGKYGNLRSLKETFESVGKILWQDSAMAHKHKGQLTSSPTPSKHLRKRIKSRIGNKRRFWHCERFAVNTGLSRNSRYEF
jgi:hypothetical protein